MLLSIPAQGGTYYVNPEAIIIGPGTSEQSAIIHAGHQSFEVHGTAEEWARKVSELIREERAELRPSSKAPKFRN